MRLKKDVEIVNFLDTVKQCTDDVFLETDEGDRLNLKSTLSQYVFAACANGRGFLEQSQVICSEEDKKKLGGFLEE